MNTATLTADPAAGLPAQPHSTVTALDAMALASADVVFSANLDFNLNQLLPFAQQFFGLSQDSAAGKPLFALLDKSLPDDALNEIRQVTKTATSWRGILPFVVNGDVVWRDTFVRPVFRKKRVVGTQWLLSQPEPALIHRAKTVYAGNVSKAWLAVLAISVALIALFILSFVALPAIAYPVMTVTAVALGFVAKRYLVLRQPGADNELDAAHFPLQQQVFARAPATALVDYELALKEGALYVAMSRIDAGTDELAEALSTTKGLSQELASAAEESSVTAEQIAAASEQMTAAIEDITASAEATAGECKEARETVAASSRLIDEASESVTELATYIERSASATSALVEKSESAKQVSERIDKIAEQTNLLALNAAIEAARAGESGRGFSVVADEVRALSQSTQDAVDEIEETITSIADSIKAWQRDMNEQVALAERCNRYGERSKQEMLSIREVIGNIADQMHQVAASSTENQQALAEVNIAIRESRQAASAISQSAAQTFDSVDSVGHRIREFRSLTTAFEDD